MQTRFNLGSNTTTCKPHQKPPVLFFYFQISTILLERNDGLLQDYLREIVFLKAPTFSKLRNLQQSTALQTLFDPSSLIFGPAWLRFLASVSQVPNLSDDGPTRLLLVQSLFKSIFLNETEISYLSCDKGLFDRLVILQKSAPKADKVTIFFQYFLSSVTTGFAGF